MAYTNLDEILTRTENFNKTADDIYDMAHWCVEEDEACIFNDDRLINILKISKILKTAEGVDFNEIKNIDNNFVCDGDKIIVKFENSPIEYILTYDADDECLKDQTLGLDCSEDRYIIDLYNFINKTLDYIEIFEQKFIKKLNNILECQDALYNKLDSRFIKL
jgi:hypothetical protein